MMNLNVKLPSVHLGLACLFIVFFITGCDDQGDQNGGENQANESKKLNGLKKSYYSKDKIKTAVNYKDGKKHGMSTSYYENGNKQLEMPYNMGVREGISKKYYEKGTLYAETPYVNGEIEGMRKTFFTNGTLKAETPYKYSLIGTGTLEYGTDGQPLSGYTLSVKQVSSISEAGFPTFEVKLDRQCKKIIFYEGDLIDDRYLDEGQVVPLQMSGSKGIFVNKYYEEDLNFICKCNTMGGNVAIANIAVSYQ